MNTSMRYAAVTPARDEADNLPRLARSLAAQTVPPAAWVIVDNGSSDGTVEIARELAARFDWVHLLEIPGEGPLARGKASVRAFQAGLDHLRPHPEVVVQLDADVSFERDYFERLLAEFAADPRLGLASGSAYEQRGGTWRQIHVTGGSVWGATRAYRRECLAQVLPLEERIGWDGIDEMKAKAHGWRTSTITSLRFDHHRPEGSRDGSARTAPWIARGRAAHYMGYRTWYLALRALRYSFEEPAAFAMLWAYFDAARRKEPVCEDPAVRTYLRRDQSLLKLPGRVMQSFGLRRSS